MEAGKAENIFAFEPLLRDHHDGSDADQNNRAPLQSPIGSEFFFWYISVVILCLATTVESVVCCLLLRKKVYSLFLAIRSQIITNHSPHLGVYMIVKLLQLKNGQPLFYIFVNDNQVQYIVKNHSSSRSQERYSNEVQDEYQTGDSDRRTSTSSEN